MPIDLPAKDRRAMGQRVRILREASDLTQAALAELVHVTQPTVCAWEKGEYVPSFHTQNAVADVLHTRRSLLYRELCQAEDRAIA
jgi:DNA-binding XRE family transcriptional regulator